MSLFSSGLVVICNKFSPCLPPEKSQKCCHYIFYDKIDVTTPTSKTGLDLILKMCDLHMKPDSSVSMIKY